MINHNKLINKISKIVGIKNTITDSYKLEFHNKDWRGFYNFKSICCVFPENTKQVQSLLKYFNKYRNSIYELVNKLRTTLEILKE